MQAMRALRAAARALDRTGAKLAKQAEAICSTCGIPAQGRPGREAAAEAFASISAHMDFLGRLKQLHHAQLRTEVAASELVSPQPSLDPKPPTLTLCPVSFYVWGVLRPLVLRLVQGAVRGVEWPDLLLCPLEVG